MLCLAEYGYTGWACSICFNDFMGRMLLLFAWCYASCWYMVSMLYSVSMLVSLLIFEYFFFIPLSDEGSILQFMLSIACWYLSCLFLLLLLPLGFSSFFPSLDRLLFLLFGLPFGLSLVLSFDLLLLLLYVGYLVVAPLIGSFVLPFKVDGYWLDVSYGLFCWFSVLLYWWRFVLLCCWLSGVVSIWSGVSFVIMSLIVLVTLVSSVIILSAGPAVVLIIVNISSILIVPMCSVVAGCGHPWVLALLWCQCPCLLQVMDLFFLSTVFLL